MSVKPPAWIRWIFVLPAVMLTYHTAWKYSMRAMKPVLNSLWWNWLDSGLMYAIWGWCGANLISVSLALLVGTFIAPSKSKAVSIVLACLFIVFAVFLYIHNGHPPKTLKEELLAAPLWQTYLECISIGVSAIISCVCIIRSNKE